MYSPEEYRSAPDMMLIDREKRRLAAFLGHTDAQEHEDFSEWNEPFQPRTYDELKDWFGRLQRVACWDEAQVRIAVICARVAFDVLKRLHAAHPERYEPLQPLLELSEGVVLLGADEEGVHRKLIEYLDIRLINLYWRETRCSVQSAIESVHAMTKGLLPSFEYLSSRLYPYGTYAMRPVRENVAEKAADYARFSLTSMFTTPSDVNSRWEEIDLPFRLHNRMETELLPWVLDRGDYLRSRVKGNLDLQMSLLCFSDQVAENPLREIPLPTPDLPEDDDDLPF